MESTVKEIVDAAEKIVRSLLVMYEYFTEEEVHATEQDLLVEAIASNAIKWEICRNWNRIMKELREYHPIRKKLVISYSIINTHVLIDNGINLKKNIEIL